MTPVTCPREQDVLDAVAARRWPARCDADLAAHVAGCAVCADLAEVAMVLRDEHETAVAAAPVPSAGVVWWRAELRARREAARRVTQPITVLQVIAAVVALVVCIGLAYAFASPAIDNALSLAQRVADQLATPPAATPREWWVQVAATPRLWLAALAGLSLLVGPPTIYFALRD